MIRATRQRLLGPRARAERAAAIRDMGSPVRCSYCGAVYDLQGAPEGQPGFPKIIARYGDCDVYVAPCCGRQADTREYVGLPSFRRIDLERPRSMDGVPWGKAW